MALSAVQARRAKESDKPIKKRRMESPELPGNPSSLLPDGDHVSLPRGFSPSFLLEEVPKLNNDNSSEDADIVEASLSFQPAFGVNYFHLTDLECQMLRQTSSSQSGVAVILQENCSLTFSGSIDIMILSGCVIIMGVKLYASPICHTVYAPRSHPIPSVSSYSCPSANHRSPPSLPPRFQYLGPSDGALLALFKNTSGIEALQSLSPRYRGLFPSDNQSSWSIGGFRIENSDSRSNLALSHDWEQAIERISTLDDCDPNVIMVQGPKGAGKSTFARMLLNTLISGSRSVAYLDCDSGQSEFSPPGFVSLHLLTTTQFGPSYTNIRQPVSAHYIGSATPKTNPDYYVSCISALLDTFQTDIQYSTEMERVGDDTPRPVPLIVNTQGWVKGLGADLLVRITETVKPTLVVNLERDIAKGVLNALKLPADIQQIPLQAVSPADTFIKLSASDLRDLSLMSYFHSRYVGGKIKWDTSVCLGAQAPLELHCRIALDRIAILGAEGDMVIESELENALAGALVGLVLDESIERVDVTSEFPYRQGEGSPVPSSSTCLGLGLVRYASRDEGILQIVTPLDVESVVRCRMLVKGELELPVVSMLAYGDAEDNLVVEGPEALFDVEIARVPYLQWQGVSTGLGASKRRVRRNVMRRGQM